MANNNNTFLIDSQVSFNESVRNVAPNTKLEQLAVQASYDNLLVTKGQDLVQVNDTLIVLQGSHLDKPAGTVYISPSRISADLTKGYTPTTWSTKPAIKSDSIVCTAGGGFAACQGFYVIAYTQDLESQPPALSGTITHEWSYYGGYQQAEKGYNFQVKFINDVAAFFVPTVYVASTAKVAPSDAEEPVFGTTLGDDDSYVIALAPRAKQVSEVAGIIPYSAVELELNCPGAQLHVFPVSYNTEIFNIPNDLSVGGNAYSSIFEANIRAGLANRMQDLGIPCNIVQA